MSDDFQMPPRDEAYGPGWTDVDGDGNLDVILVGQLRPDLVVMLGNGHRGFRPGPGLVLPLGVLSPSGAQATVVLQDLDGDRRADLLVDASGGILLMKGDGSGGFGPDPASAWGALAPSSAAVTADFSGRGQPQVLLNSPSVLVEPGADGGMAPVAGFAVTWPDGGPGASDLLALQAVDFDRDGRPDVVGFIQATGSPSALAVAIGDGRGGLSLTLTAPWAPGDHSESHLAAGDFDGDGFPDLAASDPGSGQVLVLLNDAGAGFGPPTLLPAGRARPGSPGSVALGPGPLAVGDFDGDGLADLAVLNTLEGKLYTYLGTRGAGLRPGGPRPVSGLAIAAGDVDGDGRADVVVLAESLPGPGLYLLRGRSGGLGDPEAIDLSVRDPIARRLVLADLDGDGWADLGLGGLTGTALLLGDGMGRFPRTLELPLAGNQILVGMVMPDGRRAVWVGGTDFWPTVATLVPLSCH